MPASFFSAVHPRFQTPYVTTILTGVVVGVLSSLASIDEMVNLTNIGTLFAFVLVAVGVLVLRRTNPNAHRPFRTPLVPLVPILGILVCGYMMASLPRDTWIRLIVWMLLGIVIYFLYGRNHSVLQRTGHQVLETEPSRPNYTEEK